MELSLHLPKILEGGALSSYCSCGIVSVGCQGGSRVIKHKKDMSRCNECGWILFALLQLYWVLRIFLQFRRFRQVEIRLVEPTVDPANDNNSMVKRREHFFPWFGSLLSRSSVVGILILFGAVIVMELGGETTTFLHPGSLWWMS